MGSWRDVRAQPARRRLFRRGHGPGWPLVERDVGLILIARVEFCVEQIGARLQSADMTGMVAVVTGGRVRIGYEIALKLLREHGGWNPDSANVEDWQMPQPDWATVDGG